MDFISREYFFKGLKYKAYCDLDGTNGKLALEDIVSIILKFSNDNRDPVAVTREKVDQLKLETIKYDNVHLVDADTMIDFYQECDDLSTISSYSEFQEFAELLAGRMTDLIERNLIPLGNVGLLIPEWNKLAIEISLDYRNEDLDETGRLKLSDWLKRTYKLEIDWLRSLLVKKSMLIMSYAFRATSGSRPIKENLTNVFEPHEFAIIHPVITKLLSESNSDWVEAIKKYAKNTNSKVIGEVRSEVQKQKELGISTDKIIKSVFDVTPESHLVTRDDRNYLYEALQVFINAVMVSPKTSK